MPNTDELLWPGTLVTAQADLPRRGGRRAVAAVQVSQTGTFVFVVKDGVAKVQPVKVARDAGGRFRDRKRASRAARPW